ncbi:MAG: hypothetical protein Q7K40_03785 [bacterium]|nr:hypothetical protein [bacterium]
MFENFHINKKVEKVNTGEEIREDFQSNEKRILNESTDFLEKLEPEKFKKKSANLLLALSLFASASSAFASEQNTDKELPAVGEEGYSQARDKKSSKNQIADFDWQKIATKIEISIGTTKEEVNGKHLESISPWWDKTTAEGIMESKSEFYKGVTLADVYEYTQSQFNAILGSSSASEFFINLPASQKGGFSEKQKVMILQDIGYYLEKTYNKDILNSGEFVAVSDDKMFKALRGQVDYYYPDTTSGTCGNIHTFLVKTAESLGVEAWLQGGSFLGDEGKSNHIWTGLAVGEGEQKQIAFLDYGTLVPTGTLDYHDALGVAERYHRSVTVLNTFVGNSSELLFPVKSRAQEVVGMATALEESVERLETNLEQGKIKKEGKSLEIKISPEIKEIKLGNDSVGLAFFKFEDTQNNPYQSLKSLSAWRGKIGASSENLGVELGVTVLNMDVKTLRDEAVSSEELVVNLAVDYIDQKQFTKDQYGEFVINWGATLAGAISRELGGNSKNSKNSLTGGQADATYGGRLVYVDPNNVGRFYVEASNMTRGTFTDYQNQNIATKEVAKNFVIGGEVKVFEGSIINVEVKNSELDWGERSKIEIGLEEEKFKSTVSYEKKTSEYERFIPSSEKIELGVTYKIGPKWQIDVMGAKTSEKYKDAQRNSVYNAEVKLRLFLW